MTAVLIPKLQKIRSNDTNYLKRLTAVYAYEPLLKNFHNELQDPCVREVLLDLKDKVVNVRIVALKVLYSAINRLDDSAKQTIKSHVQGLCKDSDPDIRQLATLLVAA